MAHSAGSSPSLSASSTSRGGVGACSAGVGEGDGPAAAIAIEISTAAVGGVGSEGGRGSSSCWPERSVCPPPPSVEVKAVRYLARIHRST